jgi:VWFA-related protein
MRFPMRCLELFAAGALLVSAQSDEVHVSAHAYTPPQVRLTVETQLVQTEVVVRDPRGHAVSGLKQGDFEVFDEGKPRDIAAFSVVQREAAMPAPAPAAAPASTNTTPASAAAALPPPPPLRSTLLFFDNLHESPAELQRTQIAARSFIRDGLGPGARMGIYASSEGLILDFTADTGALTAAIQKLHSHQRISESGLQPCPRINPYQAFLIANNLDLDALNAAVQEAQQCSSADSSLPQVTGRNSKLLNPASIKPDPNVFTVLAQASQTWEKTREDSLNAFDAIGNAMTLLARARGTRVLLMVSTGFLTGLLDAERDAATDRAIHSGIVINALDAKGLWTEAPGRPFGEITQTVGSLSTATFVFETTNIGSRNDAMNAVMAEFASATGGLFFHDSNDLAGGFAQLGAVPETTYLVAFHPDTEGAAGRYHKLKVRLRKGNGDYVQTRPGYVAAPNGPGVGPAEPRPIDREVLGSEVVSQFPVQLSGRLGKSDKGDPTLSLLIHVDLAKLNFAGQDGRHVQKLVFIGALLDGGGKMVAAKEGAMELALKDDTWARLAASGINATLGFTAPSGPYRVRVVVQDAEGKMASLNQAVEIPK